LGLETLKKEVGWLSNTVPFKMIDPDSGDYKCIRTAGVLDYVNSSGSKAVSFKCKITNFLQRPVNFS